MWHPDLHWTGPPKCVPTHLNSRSRWIQHCIPNLLWSVRIPSYALWIPKHTGSASGLYWRLSKPLYWRLHCVLLRRYTHILDQWQRAWRPPLKSAAMYTLIWAVLKGRTISIQSLGSQLPWICLQFGWTGHGVRLHIHNWRPAISRICSGCARAPRVYNLLSEIHLEICEGEGFHIKHTNDTRLMEMRRDLGCQTLILKTRNCHHQCTDSPAFQPTITDHSADQCKRLHDCRHALQWWWIWDP